MVYQLFEFAVCTTWQGGNERDVTTRIDVKHMVNFDGAHLPGMKSCGIKNIKFDLNVFLKVRFLLPLA